MDTQNIADALVGRDVPIPLRCRLGIHQWGPWHSCRESVAMWHKVTLVRLCVKCQIRCFKTYKIEN